MQDSSGMDSGAARTRNGPLSASAAAGGAAANRLMAKVGPVKLYIG